MNYANIPAEKLWWLKSQLVYWYNRPTFDQWVTLDEIESNVAAIKARIAEIEEAA